MVIFIGCTMNYSLNDGTSFWHFINSWSKISRGFKVTFKISILECYFSPEKMNLPIHLPLKMDDKKLFEKAEVPTFVRGFLSQAFWHIYGAL